MKYSKKQIIMTVIAIIFTIICFVALPSNVLIQIRGNGANGYLPKPIAVLVPAALSIGATVKMGLEKTNEKQKKDCMNYYYLSLFIFVCYILMNFIFNQ